MSLPKATKQKRQEFEPSEPLGFPESCLSVPYTRVLRRVKENAGGFPLKHSGALSA